MENLNHTNSNQEQLSVISLKSATIDDLPTLLKLEQSVSGTNLYSPMLEEEEWKEELSKNHVFLIENQNQIIGNISYEKKNPEYVYISGLVIDPTFQSKGFGKKALLTLLEELKDVDRVDLVTHPDNINALKLYQSLGFVIESRKENYFDDGEPRITLALVKTGKTIK